MKVFGFLTGRENKFINITCNLILSAMVLVVFFLSFLLPTTTETFVSGLSAIYSGNKEKNNISLMINVYWGEEYLTDMLNVLDENDVKCTFFVGGSWAAKNNDILLEISKRGHEIGNHGYFHIALLLLQQPHCVVQILSLL